MKNKHKKCCKSFFIVGVSLLGLVTVLSGMPQSLQKIQRRTAVSTLSSDLVSSFGNMGSSPVNYNASLRFNAVLQNTSSTPAKNVQVDFILSRDKVFPMKPASSSSTYAEDMLLHRWNIKTLNKTESKSVSFGDLAQRVPPGDYFIAMVADPANTVKESNEKNNIAYFPVKIGFIQISNASLHKGGQCSQPNRLLLDVKGTDFGNKDEKSIWLGPHKLQTANTLWTNNHIEQYFDTNSIPKFGPGQEYDVYITVPSPRTRGELRISNIVKVKTMYHIVENGNCDANPLTICVAPPLPPTQGTLKFVIYPANPLPNASSSIGREVKVIFWSTSKVTVDIPKLRAGIYYIFIEQHGKWISDEATYCPHSPSQR